MKLPTKFISGSKIPKQVWKDSKTKTKYVGLVLLFSLFMGVFITLKATKKGWQFPKASDNNAQNQFSAKQTPSTTPVNPPLSYPIFGQVQTQEGREIPDAQVVVQIEKDNMKSTFLSTTVGKDGRFILDLGNAKKEDGTPFSLADIGYETLIVSFTTPDKEKGELRTSLAATNNQPLVLVVSKQPISCPKDPDIDQNGVVNVYDYSLLISNYSLAETHVPESLTEVGQNIGDVNCDRKINALDISLLITYFNEPIK